MVGYKQFVDMTTFYAADVNLLMSQTVARFEALTERDAALPGPTAGQMCYTPTRGLQIWNGSAWAPTPGTVMARLKRTSSATIAANAAIPWDEETFDTYLGHSLTTDPTRYICPVAGNYIVHASVHHGVISQAGVTVLGYFYKSGDVVSSHAQTDTESPSSGSHVDFTDCVQAEAGDFLELGVGNSSLLTTNAAGSYMVIVYAGF